MNHTGKTTVLLRCGHTTPADAWDDLVDQDPKSAAHDALIRNSRSGATQQPDGRHIHYRG